MGTVNLEIEVTLDGPGRRPRAGTTSRGEDERPRPPRIPRVTRLMALAIRFQDMIDRGEVRDYAELARLGYVTRARMTQIMNLLNLAPDIQEEILFREDTQAGGAPIYERQVRCVTRHVDWERQRRMWGEVRAEGEARQ